MKLFRSDQIKQIDELTIKEEPVSSIDLMERASSEVVKWFIRKFDRSCRIFVFAGPGNNGGDGLAIARLLEFNRFEVFIIYLDFTDKTSQDFRKNLERIKTETKINLLYLTSKVQFPLISDRDIIIDAIFGTGLSRYADGLAAEIIGLINQERAVKISIDIPSGMFGEDNSGNDYEKIVAADYTLSFQFPKISFMFAENSRQIGELVVLPIGLSTNAIRNIISPYVFLEKTEVSSILKKRNKFDHKGTFGHGLLVSGSIGKMGAAVLGTTAALRSGIGLITTHVPLCGLALLQSAVPEGMGTADKHETFITKIGSTVSFNAVGVGPGIGTNPETHEALFDLIKECKKPMVIDADGLNILSSNKSWLSLIHRDTILTPHPKEFERLAGKSENGYIRLMNQIEFAQNYGCIVILKGAYTSIATPEGRVFFNTTGNPGMAKGGSGDTLTGIILSLLAQGYLPEQAAILGVYIHGLAGDIAVKELSYESVLASDIINCLAMAFTKLKEPV